MHCCSRKGPSWLPTSATSSSPGPRTIPKRSPPCNAGFHHPEQVAETVRGWHFGRRSAITSNRAREVLTELVPPLLAAWAALPTRTERSSSRSGLGRMPAAVELLDHLAIDDRLRLLFADLLGTAPRLADTVAQAPARARHADRPGLRGPAHARRRSRNRSGSSSAIRPTTKISRPHPRRSAPDAIRLGGPGSSPASISPAQAGEAYAAIADAVIRVCFGTSRRPSRPSMGPSRARGSQSWGLAASAPVNSRPVPISTSS